MQNVIIPRPKEFKEKKKKIIKEGKEKLHVLSDFDSTLTKGAIKGRRSPSLIAQLREKDYISKEYAKKAHEFFNKYRPIEIDPKIPKEKKSKLMHEWWKKHFNWIIECGLNMNVIRTVVKDMVKNKEIQLREGVLNFLKTLHKKELPLVILSASTGDIIKEFLKKQGCFFENIYIIANFLKLDKKEEVIGVEEPIIHSMNKKEIVIKNMPFFEKIKSRTNVILLGDKIEDLDMTEGENWKTILKIGFLNEKIDEMLERYKENFDVIIINDGSIDFVLKLIKEIK